MDVDPDTGRVRVPLGGPTSTRSGSRCSPSGGRRRRGVPRDRLPEGRPRRMEVPTSAPARPPGSCSAPGRHAAAASTRGRSCDPDEERAGEEESGLVREITVSETGSWSSDGEVVARSTSATQRLLEPILQKTRVRASSTYQGEPAVGAQLAFDGDQASFWAASPGDPRPTLRLRWPHRGGWLSSINVVAPHGTAVAPARAQLQGNGGLTREVDLGRGTARFAPLHTRRLVIRFEAPDTAGVAAHRCGRTRAGQPGQPGAP